MKICPTCQCGSVGRPVACPGCGTALLDVGERGGDDLSGMVIDGKYALTELLGEGAMGWVYQGRHLALDSTIAVKLMKPSGAPDEARDERFAREARAASRLNNPHIISIIDFGRTPGGLLYIVSEYLRGITLSGLLEKEPHLPMDRALKIMDQVLSAVDEAHGAGLVHRDLKPDNIIITPMRSGEDFVKVLDFGIAKMGDPRLQRLTVQGQLFGTPAYMAPEQIRGHEVSARTDLYACALILYEMLTGREAFGAEAVMEVLSMQLHTSPEPFGEVAPDRQIPEALEAIVMRGLAKDAAERFGSAAEMREVLHRSVRFRSQMLPAVGLVSCEACGQSLPDGVRFCPDCGARQGEPDRAHGAMAPTVAGAPASGSLQAANGGARVDLVWDGDPPGDGAVHSTLARRLRKERTLRFELVGRGREIRAMDAFFGGGRRVAQILGPMGSGRSRMLEATGELARAHGLRVVRAGSDPQLARTPWYPVHAVLEELLGFGQAQPSLEDLKERAIGLGLAPADVPGLAELFGHAGEVEYAVRRREAHAAALRAIYETSLGRSGVCLLLDEADEYDGASRQWFLGLASERGQDRVFVVMTGEKELVSEALEPLTLTLPPLDEEAVEVLAASALERTEGLAPHQIQSLLAASGGNAFHLEQALRLLAEEGMEEGAALGDLLALRIGRLPTGALRLLQCACVLGSKASLPLVERLFDASASVRDALLLLERRGLILRADSDEVEVSHPLIAVAVRENMPADARRRLHLSALALLKEKGAHVIHLARHALEGHVGEEAVTLLRAAGKQAEKWLDDAGAAYFYQQAMQVARFELLLDEGTEECLELSLYLGDCLRFSGQHKTAAAVLRGAIALAREQPELHARLLRSLAMVHMHDGEVGSGLEVMRGAIREAIFAGNPGLLGELYLGLGRMLMEEGRALDAVEELSEGVTLVTGGDGPDAQRVPPDFWRLLGTLAEAWLAQDVAEAALDSAVSALAQARQAGSFVGQARCHVLLSGILSRLGRDGPAAEQHNLAMAAFRRLGDRQSAAECLLSRAERCPGERDRLAGEALVLAQQVRWKPGEQRARQLMDRMG